MPFQTQNSVRYFTFETLNAQGVPHAVFTRQGGVSPAPWFSLNVGGTVGDDPQRVLENRRRSFQSVNRDFNSLYDVWQVHGKEIVCATHPRSPEQPHLKADGLATDRKHVTLYMRFADCVPILLFDPRARAVGLAHAGWQGTVLHTAAWLVRKMQTEYGSKPADLIAAIGPSIGPDHYEVGPDVIGHVQQAFPPEAFGSAAEKLLHSIQHNSDGCKVKFDLWLANRLVLESAGVRQIETAGICTACHPEDWYSHRGEHRKTGRFGALIAL